MTMVVIVVNEKRIIGRGRAGSIPDGTARMVVVIGRGGGRIVVVAIATTARKESTHPDYLID